MRCYDLFASIRDERIGQNHHILRLTRLTVTIDPINLNICMMFLFFSFVLYINE